jgi:hypothetical protein
MNENPYQSPRMPGERPQDEWFVFKRVVDAIYIGFLVLTLISLLWPAVR